MIMERQLFTISVYMENTVGMLNQVSVIFTRRNINIEGVSASPTSVPGITKLTLTAYSTRHAIEKVINQIEKRIDVIKAFLHTDNEIFFQEVALYKVPTSALLREKDLEGIIRRYNARVLDIKPEYTVIEMTGHNDTIAALLDELRPYGILQFVRSGRVSVTRTPVEHLSNYIQEYERRKTMSCD